MKLGSLLTTDALQVTRYSLERNGHRTQCGLKIAHLTDWHGKVFRRGVGYIHGLLRRERPDAVVLTGDLMGEIERLAPLRGELARIGRDFACFYVHGNNERYFRCEREIERDLRACRISVLNNVSRRWRGLRLIGVDDAVEGWPDLDRAFRGAGRDETVVVLSHSPIIYKQLLAEGRHFDLLLCGHTHGGQVCLPGGWPLWLDMAGLPRRLGRGWHRIGPGYMLVNRGLGEHLLALRLFCRPELAIVTL